jgi:hypothetical protein
MSAHEDAELIRRAFGLADWGAEDEQAVDDALNALDRIVAREARLTTALQEIAAATPYAGTSVYGGVDTVAVAREALAGEPVYEVVDAPDGQPVITQVRAAVAGETAE